MSGSETPPAQAAAMHSGDLRLYHGNSLEVLAGILANELAGDGADPLQARSVLIPQPALRRWLQNRLAEEHGIAAGLRLLTPGEWLRETLRSALGGEDDPGLADIGAMAWRIHAALADPTLAANQGIREWKEALPADGDGRSRHALATHLASVFEKYLAWRRPWLLAWERGAEPDDPQAQLWRAIARGRPHRARRIGDYLARAGNPRQGMADPLHVFACTQVSPDGLRVIGRESLRRTVHLYVPSPCRHYWGDVRSAAERLRADPDADPFLADENPLLAEFAGAGRDFVACLFAGEALPQMAEVETYAAIAGDPARRSLLQALQHDLLERQAPSPGARRPLARLDADGSLRVFRCASRLREVQVLHERLRALLDASPCEGTEPLQPAQIAVVAADIEAYRPLIEAVFGGARGQPWFVPFALAEPCALQQSAPARQLLRLLDLPRSRFGLNEIFDWLAEPACLRGMGLERMELERLRAHCAYAGVRWALDGAHRTALAGGDGAAHTWEFGLDRLLLGWMQGEDGPVGERAALAALDGADADRLGLLLAQLQRLRFWRERFALAMEAGQWQEALVLALGEQMGRPDDDERDELDQVFAAIEAWRRQVDAGAPGLRLQAGLVRQALADALAESSPRAPLLGGGVAIGPMAKLRALPFRVIAVLGLDDDFPARDAFDPLNRLTDPAGRRERGDRSRREDDRYLFLQAIANAGEVLHLSYVGEEPVSGRVRPGSVCLDVLLDTAERYFEPPTDPGQLSARARLQVLAPRWPGPVPVGSAHAGSDHGARDLLPAYRPAWHAVAGAAQAPARAPSAWGDEALADAATRVAAAPTEGLPLESLPFESLLRFWRNPSAAFLRDGLQLRWSEPTSADADLEPLALDRLQRFRLDALVLDRLRDGENDPAVLRARLAAAGHLPVGEHGAQALRAALARMRPYAAALRPWPPHELRGQPFELDIAGTRLHGVADVDPQRGLLLLRPGRLDGRYRLRHGLWALLAVALERPWPVWECGEDADAGIVLRELQPQLPVDAARRGLSWLLAQRARGLRRPLPFAPRSSYAWFRGEGRHADEATRRWSAARGEWMKSSRDGVQGEGQGSAAQWALRSADPFAGGPESPAGREFVALSERVFALLCDGRLPEDA